MGPEELRRQAELERRHFWYVGRRERLAEFVHPAPPGQRALDLGAGSGGTTSLLKEAGYDTVALEYQAPAAAVARSRGLTVLRADAQQLPFADGSFNFILATDVFEHLPSDENSVAEARRVLAPDGCLLATVPADPALWSTHDVALGHLRRYTRERVAHLFESQGFHVRVLDSWMVLPRPVVAAVRRRRRPCVSYAEAEDRPEVLVRAAASLSVAASDLIPVPRAVNALLRGVLRLEQRMARTRTGRGVSLLVLATPVEQTSG